MEPGAWAVPVSLCLSFGENNTKEKEENWVRVRLSSYTYENRNTEPLASSCHLIAGEDNFIPVFRRLLEIICTSNWAALRRWRDYISWSKTNSPLTLSLGPPYL